MPRRPTRATVDPQGGVPPRGEPLRQPNDRDESSTDGDCAGELAPVQHEQMRRAGRDADGPGEDTDCRSIPAAAGGCAQPRDPSLLDDVLVPGGRDSENRRGASHDPGAPPVGPDGAPS